MKKILTASLVAMMAVTAANADIASTTYVTDQTGASATGEFTFTNVAQGQTTLQGAVNAIADSLAANMGAGGSVETQIDNAIGDLGDSTDVADAIADAKQEAISTAGTNADTKIGALDVAKKTATEGTYFGAYEQVDGKISMTEKAFDTGFVANDQGEYTSKNAPSTAAVAEFVKAQVGATSEDLNEAIGDAQQTATDALSKANANTGDIAELTVTVNTNKELADATQTELTNYKTSNDKALSDYKVEAANTFMDSAEVGAAITAAVTNSETGALKNYSTTEQMTSVIATAKGEAIADAKTETTTQVNALKNGQVQTNTTNISTITTNLGALNGVEIPAACATGRCALVMEGGEAKWETINY